MFFYVELYVSPKEQDLTVLYKVLSSSVIIRHCEESGHLIATPLRILEITQVSNEDYAHGILFITII